MTTLPPPAAVGGGGGGGGGGPLAGRRIAFTTPSSYAPRLSHLLTLHGAVPIPTPTISVSATPRTLSLLAPHLLPSALDPFSALAFTSRNAISAVHTLLSDSAPPPLSPSGPLFTVAALGRDAELLFHGNFLHNLCRNQTRINVLVPDTPSPEGMARSLGDGHGRKVLCPVPICVELEEPPVVPEFLSSLNAAGWEAVRVAAYETRWAGEGCAGGLLEGVDGLVFTSTAEVEGLMKGLEAAGWDWGRVRERWPEMVVGAHGPVTEKGARRLGVEVDVVSERFGSFDGVVEALAKWWGAKAAGVERS